MSAVAEISRPDTAVVFTAYREDLRLVKVQRYPIMGPIGTKVGEHPGEAVQFREGILRVTDEGMPLDTGGFVPRDEALEWLRSHPRFGDPFEGFREVHQAAPPVTEAELRALMEAVLDEGKLVGIIEAEEAGWQRDALLSPAREHLERLREMIASAQAQPEEPAKKAAK